MRVRPVRVGDIEHSNATAGGNTTTLGIDTLFAVIFEWSYPIPLTRENVANLDGDTFAWLASIVNSVSKLREAAEKKDSRSPLSPMLDRAAVDSPTN